MTNHVRSVLLVEAEVEEQAQCGRRQAVRRLRRDTRWDTRRDTRRDTVLCLRLPLLPLLRLRLEVVVPRTLLWRGRTRGHERREGGDEAHVRERAYVFLHQRELLQEGQNLMIMIMRRRIKMGKVTMKKKEIRCCAANKRTTSGQQALRKRAAAAGERGWCACG